MRHPCRAAAATLILLLSPGGTLDAAAGAYDPQRTFSVEQQRRDFTLLREALEEAHPSLYWYTPEREIEAAFDGAWQALSGEGARPRTERELFQLLAPAVTLIRDGHTSLEMSRAYGDWADLQPWSFLPFSLAIENDRLYVVSNGSSDPGIAPGDQLVEIAGQPAAGLLAAARAQLSADGFSETWRDFQLIFGSLKRFLAQDRGLAPPFALGVLKPDGRRLATRVTRAPSAPGGPPPPSPAHAFRLLDGDTALLAINRFSYDDPDAVHRPVFKQLAEQKVQHLIIDLRENTGGNADLAVDLMRYLVDRPFQMITSSWARLRHPENPTFAKHLDRRTRKLLLDNNRYHHTRGGQHHFDNDAVGVKQPSPRYRFGGAVYLLTSGRTFSAASLFAASLRAQRPITLIGQETGGGEAGCSGGINQRLTLPHTGLRLQLPLFRLRSASAAPNRGRGVMPDHPIATGWREKVAGRDLEMEKARELIAIATRSTSGK